MTTTKLTQRNLLEKALEMALAQNLDMDYIDGYNHMLNQLDKKNKAPKSPTVRQLENEHIGQYIVANIGANAYTITNMIKALNLEAKFGDMTVSRVTAVCTRLVENGDLTKEVIKRQSLYRKA